MSDQFICISCWKEFAAGREEIVQHGGKVVCPFCGYVQPAPAGNTDDEEPPPPPVKLEGDEPSPDAVQEEISWQNVSDKEDDIGIEEEEEHTDRVELPPPIPEDPIGEETGVEDAEEKTPIEDIEFLKQSGTDLMSDAAVTEGLLLRDLESVSSQPVDWQLKTPSGLTFKFTDPDALLGWKKKLSTYKRLDVSPDGERWVDFSRFVREYEQIGDPLRSFMLASRLSDDDLPPPPPAELSDEHDSGNHEDTADDIMELTRERNKARNPQFTFKVREEKSGGWGKYFAFAVIGLGLGAGIVLAVLHFTGIFVLPI